MSKLRTSLVLAATLSTLSACGGDDPLGVNSGDAMTPEEIQAVFLAISDAFSSLDTGPAAAGGPAMATVSVNESFSASAPCPGEAGTIAASGSASGTATDEPFSVEVTYQLRMTPNGCVVPTESGTLTLNGAPYIQLDMDFTLSETQIIASGSETGGIAFTSSNGRSGSCAFDVVFSISGNSGSETITSSVSGTVCGVSASNLTVFEL